MYKNGPALRYFRMELPPYYRPRYGVSLLCSEWEEVVPPRSKDRAKIYSSNVNLQRAEWESSFAKRLRRDREVVPVALSTGLNLQINCQQEFAIPKVLPKDCTLTGEEIGLILSVRPISTDRLRPSRVLHLPPIIRQRRTDKLSLINVVFFNGSFAK